MAECSYARCLQERRHIKRELMKWSKDMVHIIGLERVAEELVGRRKWKQYQEALTRSQLSADISNLDQIDISRQKHEQNLEKAKENSHQQQHQPFENDVSKIKTEVFDTSERILNSPHIKKENFKSDSEVTGESIKLNNNTTSHIYNNNSKKNNEELLSPTSPTPPPPIPIDWIPNEKCNFCIDGKLLTVNEKGELVAESSPALSEADLANRRPGDTDSDSSDSLVPNTRVNANKILTSRLIDPVPPNMTSLESMAAQWNAIQSIPGLQSGLGQLYPSILYNLTQHVNSATPTTSETSAAAISPSLKDSPSPSDLTGEQPLDLSSKPSPNSSIGGDARHMHRAKPRVTPCTGRRTYTNEELNSALQDIISGRLGTRRAAVQYNIPRSTLRNKVYKISSGAKRETPTSLRHLTSLEDLADVDDDKQDLSADEEDSSGDKILSSSLALHGGDDLASRFADANLAASIQKICVEQNSLTSQQQSHHQARTDIQLHSKSSTSLEPQPKRKVSTPQPPPPQTSPSQNAWQNVLLHSLLLSGGLPIHQNIEETLQFFNALLMKQDAGLINPQLLMQLQQARQSPQSAQQQHHMHPSAAGHPTAAATVAASFQNRQPKSETPETASSVDLNEALADDPSVILKIPSYKPVAGSSTSSTSSAAAAAVAAVALCNNKNGENLSSTSPKISTPSSLMGANSLTQQLHHHHQLHQHHNPSASSANNIAGISPSSIRHTSGESQSPPSLSLREVIANSISRTFSQQANKEASSSSPAHSASSAMDHNDQYKRPSISVIKNIGGTDTSRFATAPNLLGGHHNSNHHQHHHHQHHSQNAANNNLAGGKGTRPKRGKYRNYDRDSLVEAVKAVQRGEMSVHRAGSYYGVPHSTLEYKVKERHLMRPRKREPKPQPPLDDRTGGSTSGTNSAGSASNTTKNSNIPGLSAVNSLDKLSKSGSGVAGSSVNQKTSAAGKSNPPFPTTSPNGMKIPVFDQSLAQLQYPTHLFWPGPYGPLQMLQQNAAVAAAAASGGPGNSSFAANANDIFKSQMIQRFHEERGPPNSISSPPAAASLNNPSTNVSTNNNNSKSERDIPENLYDTSGANGSFLDGIIRKTLDRKSSDLTQGALLDQLVKNSKAPPPRLMINNERTTGDLLNLKRPASPMAYHPAMEIKRERASPTSDSSMSDSEQNHRRDTDSEPLPPSASQHHAVGLHHSLLCTSSDLNGAQHGPTSSENNLLASAFTRTTTSLRDTLGQIKSETEDSL